jgi:hypothetical protein
MQALASYARDNLPPNLVSLPRHSRNARGTIPHPSTRLNCTSRLTATLLHRIDPRFEASNQPPQPRRPVTTQPAGPTEPYSPNPPCSSNQRFTCWYQNTEFWGFKIQWFSFG